MRQFFFLIASYQILKNHSILLNYKSLFQEKDSLQLNHFQFSKMDKLLSNKSINGEVVGNIFSEKIIHDSFESHNFLKFVKKR